MKISLVAGARPNFMKIAPIIKAIENKKEICDIQYRLVHTGQHYDKSMSADFFEELNIPEPHINLKAGGGSQTEQTALIMLNFEKELLKNRPDVVLVVGDVTSTMACTIVAKKLCIDVAHVEAGIRSGDRTMPEEINRVVTDAICDHFFTTSESASHNLLQSGIDNKKIHFVGNTMIDTLIQNLSRIKKPSIMNDAGLIEKGFFLLTLHRQSNVDDKENLKLLLDNILEYTAPYNVLFPVHPRTQVILDNLGYSNERLIQVKPLGYLEFIYVIKNSKAVITDSGGITEEASVLKVPCLTLRNSTERPETISIGSNVLVGTNPENLKCYLKDIINNKWKEAGIPPLWDGKTSERIVNTLVQIYSRK
jgi:UDP-N-acetylglucosamine 2-epimerase (non-hydrolysing)